ncbi:MAG: hypothetical protein WD468_08150 [Pirellulales bacterium]
MTKYWTVLVATSLTTPLALLALFAPAPFARADIFEWEYINPANPALGKQQSTTLAPDGAGVNDVPGANLLSRNLTMAYRLRRVRKTQPQKNFPKPTPSSRT